MTMRTGVVSAIAATAFFFMLTVFFGSWYTIDEGERGVILRNGAITGTAGPGLGFKLPIIDDVVTLSVQNRIAAWDDLEAYSRDQQPAHMRLSVNYRLAPDQVEAIYATYGSEEAVLSRLIQPRAFQQLKTTFGQFNAAMVIQDRERFNSEARTAIADSIEGPVHVESVQIEDIAFSDPYEKSVEDRMLAEVEVLKLKQNAEREKVQAEITVTQATARADSVRAEAQAQADAIILKGDADAHAIRVANLARVEALQADPAIVAYIQASNWNGQLPTTMLPNGSIPMLNITP